jgi:integrase
MANLVRNKSGTTTVRYIANGQNHSETFKRSTDARRFKRDIEHQLDTGTYINPNDGQITLAEWITDWHHTRLNLRPSTATRDASYIRTLINPHLGRHQLRHLSAAHIRTWIATLNETYAPATTRKAHQLLRASVQAAVDDRILATNPCQTTKLPRQEKSEHRYLSFPEIHALAESIDPRYRAFVFTGALAGCRPGELAALHWQHVDLRNQKLTINLTAHEHRGQLRYGPPKTAKSYRTISIPSTLVEILAEHSSTYGPGDNVIQLAPNVNGVNHVNQTAGNPVPQRNLTDATLTPPTSTTSITSMPVFTGPDGGPLRLTNLRRRQWRRAVEGSVGAPMRIHDLRHTHAAIMIAENVSMRVLQERLGHESIETTMNVYGGLYQDYDETVVDALDAAFVASLRQ